MGDLSEHSGEVGNHSHPLLPRAVALHRDGRLDAAAALYREILSDLPRDFDATHLLGVVALQQGEFDAAQRLIHAALGMNPHDTSAMANLGTSYLRIGQLESALQWFELALRLEPDSQTAKTNVGTALDAMGRRRDTVPRSPLSSIAPGPEVAGAGPSPHVLAAYGSALLSNGLYDEAIEQFERAVELDGTNLSFRWTLAIARLKPIYTSEFDLEVSRSAFAKALEEIESWYRRSEDIKEPFRAVGVSQPFYLAYQPFSNRELLSQYGALCSSWMTTLPPDISGAGRRSGTRGADRAHGRLRIGIASAHLHQHSVWNAITRGWVCNIDRAHFELYLFKLDVTSDRETEMARGAVTHFEDRPNDLPGWIRTISSQDLDVLIYPEIGMHPLTLQLASLRLAPVQAAAWGHPETTGLPTMDLYISADSFEPVNASENYVEELVRLPNLGVYVEPLAPAISNPSLGSLNLPRNEPLLLCPGAPFKYSPLYDDVWAQIARRLRRKLFRRGGGGRLVFFRSGSDMTDRILERRLRAVFEKADIGFDEHVSIIPTLDRSRFFGLMRQSALMLDTLGFSGFNTALQAIECDLPVLAFEGEFMRGRLASAIMRRLDLPELVATTTEDFVQKALELARDPGRRKKIRAKIIERRDALFHDMAPVRALERHLTDAVARSRARASPGAVLNT